MQLKIDLLYFAPIGAVNHHYLLVLKKSDWLIPFGQSIYTFVYFSLLEYGGKTNVLLFKLGSLGPFRNPYIPYICERILSIVLLKWVV
jgi:hypothetical protein